MQKICRTSNLLNEKTTLYNLSKKQVRDTDPESVFQQNHSAYTGCGNVANLIHCGCNDYSKKTLQTHKRIIWENVVSKSLMGSPNMGLKYCDKWGTKPRDRANRQIVLYKFSEFSVWFVFHETKMVNPLIMFVFLCSSIVSHSTHEYVWEFSLILSVTVLRFQFCACILSKTEFPSGV